MEDIYIIIFILLVVFIVLLFNRPCCESITNDDERLAEKILSELENSDNIPSITSEMLEKLKDKVGMIKSPSKEGLKFFPQVNTRYWPQYFYSKPFQYQITGGIPDGIFSRLRHWEPGFSTGSGWMYHLRPGLSRKYHPRNRWIKHTAFGGDMPSYYYITNSEDTIRGANDYSKLI